MPLFDMHCNNKKCPSYNHSETYLLKKHNQKVTCSGCGTVLEKQVSAQNIGRSNSKKQDSNFPKFLTILILDEKTMSHEHKVNVIEAHNYIRADQKNYKIPNSLN